MSLRFSTEAAATLRDAIRQAGGVEVFAIGDVDAGTVVSLTVTCRGTQDAVPALLSRPRTGQVVIHNHPSGNLTPSGADMHLAGRYGDDGVGVVIVDSTVQRSNWVVEPHAERQVALDPASVDRFFHEQLPLAIADYEPREAQVAMAHGVARGLSENTPYVVEAGTGTGKSMAYLGPAALWALANDSKVVVSTYTKALQNQLMLKDIPLLRRAGIDVRAAELQGRNNYLCRRRLGAIEVADGEVETAAEVDTLRHWSETTSLGHRGDLPVPIDPTVWERVESDSDLTLRVRCPHYASCHYYVARRRAADAHIIVVNHALLLSDLALKDSGASGILPKYERLIVDEAHHLEDAATGVISRQLSARAVQRATAPLLDRSRRRGALTRLAEVHSAPDSPLEPQAKERLGHLIDQAKELVSGLRGRGPELLEELAGEATDGRGNALRITDEVEASERWEQHIAPAVDDLGRAYRDTSAALASIGELFEDVKLSDNALTPLLDLNRARKRLAGQSSVASDFLDRQEGTCRWLAPARGRGPKRASLHAAPIDVSPVLQRILWGAIPGTTATSATLTVGGRFAWWARRSGMTEACAHAIHASPFDHSSQALLALPRDMPTPNEPDFLSRANERILQAIQLSGGGTFVLCTSYAAIDSVSRHLRQHLTGPVLAQGDASRGHLLERYRADPRSVLVGTDSFWEGVDVKGHALRQVIIPRLPFRVPTDPLAEAQYELERARNRDPFRARALPRAVIKLRQGYGRLIRSRTDRGVVLILDRRIHERSYGRIMLSSLPPAKRINAPWRRVEEVLREFWAEGAGPP